MSDFLEVRELAFSYPDGRKALRGVDLTVGADERVAVLGPNGAGKTTLALHLNGILRGDTGSIVVSGIPVVEDHFREIRRIVALVFQDPNDQLFMPTVREDVAFGPLNLGIEGFELERCVEAALETVSGQEFADRPPHHLSGGEKRRAALATVLSMDPELLVLDEPTAGLDPASRRELIQTLGSLSMAQLIITHDLSLALELCERSIIMNAGKVVADGSTRELLGDEGLLAANRLETPYGFDPSAGSGRTSR